MKINLFDNAFRHIPISVHGKTSKNISYVRDQLSWDGITLFTDVYLNSHVPSQINSKHKVGWLLESRDVNPLTHAEIGKYINNFDFIITHDKEILEKYPDKTKKSIYGGCWIDEENYEVYNKCKNVSLIYSHKKALEGHRLRHSVADKKLEDLDLFGNGSDHPIEKKEEALVDYHFSLVIENVKRENYFTEKIVDCFATGTIPIYYGCPNIGDYFDVRGIIQIETEKQILDILPKLNEDFYSVRLPAVRSNFEKFKEYAITEDWLYHNILKYI